MVVGDAPFGKKGSTRRIHATNPKQQTPPMRPETWRTSIFGPVCKLLAAVVDLQERQPEATTTTLLVSGPDDQLLLASSSSYLEAVVDQSIPSSPPKV